MNRRKFIGAVTTPTLLGLAGCTENDDTQTETTTNTETTTPEASELRGSYVHTHKDEMQMIGMQSDGRLNVALMYAVPHEFFLTTGTRTQKVEVRERDTMHLMVSVWDGESKTLAPSVEPSVTVYKDDEEVTNFNPWAMLSQQMGFHFGDNIQISGEANYRFEIALNEESSALEDDLQGVFDESTFTFEKEFNPFDAQGLGQMDAENAGDAGAIPPMDMGMMPVPVQPEYSEMPIEMTDPQYSNDMAVAVGALSSDIEYSDQPGSRLVVSPQTRYNRYLMPLMSVAAVVERDGEIIYEGSLQSSLHQDLGLFYGVNVSNFRDGDTVNVAIKAPSQVARGLGYEEAFLKTETFKFTL